VHAADVDRFRRELGLADNVDRGPQPLLERFQGGRRRTFEGFGDSSRHVDFEFGCRAGRGLAGNGAQRLEGHGPRGFPGHHGAAGQDFGQRRATPPSRHLQEAELGKADDMGAQGILVEGVAQDPVDALLAVAAAHGDEIDDDKATQVAQPDLAGDLAGRLFVGELYT